MQFELEAQRAKLTSLTVRCEKHGVDDVLALTLKLSAKVPNTLLAMFGPQLRASLYQTDPTQSSIPGVDPEPTSLRNPFLGGIPVEFTGTGYEVAISYGIGDPIVLALAEIKKVTLTPEEGGTVSVDWTLNAGRVEDRDVGRIAGLLKREVTMTQTAPKADDAKEDGDWPFPQGGGKTGKRGKKASAAVVTH